MRRFSPNPPPSSLSFPGAPLSGPSGPEYWRATSLSAQKHTYTYTFFTHLNTLSSWPPLPPRSSLPSYIFRDSSIMTTTNRYRYYSPITPASDSGSESPPPPLVGPIQYPVYLPPLHTEFVPPQIPPTAPPVLLTPPDTPMVTFRPIAYPESVNSGMIPDLVELSFPEDYQSPSWYTSSTEMGISSVDPASRWTLRGEVVGVQSVASDECYFLNCGLPFLGLFPGSLPIWV